MGFHQQRSRKQGYHKLPLERQKTGAARPRTYGDGVLPGRWSESGAQGSKCGANSRNKKNFRKANLGTLSRTTALAEDKRTSVRSLLLTKTNVFTKLLFESSAWLDADAASCPGATATSTKAVFSSFAFSFRILFEAKRQVKTMAAQLRMYMMDCAASSQTNATLRSELLLAASASSCDELLSRSSSWLAMAASRKYLPGVKQIQIHAKREQTGQQYVLAAIQQPIKDGTFTMTKMTKKVMRILFLKRRALSPRPTLTMSESFRATRIWEKKL